MRFLFLFIAALMCGCIANPQTLSSASSLPENYSVLVDTGYGGSGHGLYGKCLMAVESGNILKASYEGSYYGAGGYSGRNEYFFDKFNGSNCTCFDSFPEIINGDFTGVQITIENCSSNLSRSSDYCNLNFCEENKYLPTGLLSSISNLTLSSNPSEGKCYDIDEFDNESGYNRAVTVCFKGNAIRNYSRVGGYGGLYYYWVRQDI